MKKAISVLVSLLLLLLLSSAALAGDLSGFEAKVPEGIDLTPFKSETYTVTFDPFKYTADIVNSGRITAGVGYENRDKFYIDFQVQMVLQSYTPMIKGTNYSLDDGLGTIYIRTGEHRYAITVSDSEKYYCYYNLDELAFTVLKEIASTDQPVFITTGDYTKKASYELTNEDKAAITQFINDCEMAGIKPATSNNTLVITAFD